MSIQDTKENNYGKAISSLIIGIISIFGLFFIKEGTLLSVAGLMIGVMSLKEAKVEQIGRKLGLVGIVLNSIGFVGFIIFMLQIL